MPEIKRKVLPERLKKRLIGELILNFDREFPVIMARIDEIDEKISKIVSGVIFLMEDVMSLPEHVREPVLKAITGGNKYLEERLISLHRTGSEHFWEWLDVALELAEKRIKKIDKMFREEK